VIQSFATEVLIVLKRHFYGSWTFGLVSTFVIILCAIGIFLITWKSTEDSIAQGLVTKDAAAASMGSFTVDIAQYTVGAMALFWIFMFPIARRERAAKIAARARIQERARLLESNEKFFEALCPTCNARITVFRDECSDLNCTCGVRLGVKKLGRSGTLEPM
jgi:hypothetical protein